MTDKPDWEIRFEAELRRAAEARRAGNEGMARVCARRAAGVVVRAYFDRSGWVPRGMSALNLLRALRDADAESEQTRTLAGHFLLQITEDHLLPGEIDLLAGAEQLKETLFPED
ncbi:MAG TPA: hypothetical protein VMN57_12955 [Anaerolineales bacterium]|nr:hypothetical protein [Anaerolineales bacterium]